MPRPCARPHGPHLFCSPNHTASARRQLEKSEQHSKPAGARSATSQDKFARYISATSQFQRRRANLCWTTTQPTAWRLEREYIQVHARNRPHTSTSRWTLPTSMRPDTEGVHHGSRRSYATAYRSHCKFKLGVCNAKLDPGDKVSTNANLRCTPSCEGAHLSHPQTESTRGST